MVPVPPFEATLFGQIGTWSMYDLHADLSIVCFSDDMSNKGEGVEFIMLELPSLYYYGNLQTQH